jgi:hypothetical protein
MLLSLIICVVGLIVYFACDCRVPRVAEAGRLAYFAGLLAWLLQGAKLL